jgi:fermentation-respiration switch protein FrsA (DUF1100 family)
VEEVRGQPGQLIHARAALNRLRIPVHIIHGDMDDFAPVDIAEKLAAEIKARRPVRFERVVGANHFMAEGPVEVLNAAIERCIPPSPARRTTTEQAVTAFATVVVHGRRWARTVLPRTRKGETVETAA